MAFYSKVSPCFFSILPMSPTFQTSAFDENETDGAFKPAIILLLLLPLLSFYLYEPAKKKKPDPFVR